MRNIGSIFYDKKPKVRFGIVILILCFILSSFRITLAQNISVSSGSYIVNMGITPQTVGNGLKPYGMIYDLIKNYNVPIIWSINPNKSKDGVDFNYKGIDFKGGPFIIPAEYRNTIVNNRIAYWQSQGVIGTTTSSIVQVPLKLILETVPRWTLDQKNGAIIVGYFINAGIPSSAHGGSLSEAWKTPDMLGCCDDLFVMPHADPTWLTHNNLFTWNRDCRGGIWAACHAVSALENMVNPNNRSQQTNFLTKKDPSFTGLSGNYSLSNTLVLWGDHSDGSLPFTHVLPQDPVAQYIGTTDGAQQNGSEQIFLPRQGIVSDPTLYSSSAVARWNPSTKIIAFDPTQSDVTNPDLTTNKNIAAAIIYGRAFEDINNGLVMYQSGHSHNKATSPDNIAAQRAFFNFALVVSSERAVTPDISMVPVSMTSTYPVSLTYNLPVGVDSLDYTTKWSASCGGSFSINNSSKSVVYNPPIVSTQTTCIINVTISDACGRTFSSSKIITINPCILTVNPSVSHITCNGKSDGSINMNISNGVGPFNWNWSRISPVGTGFGSGSLITNLSEGTYNITVNTPTGCSTSFQTQINQPNLLTVNPSVNNYLCEINKGAINLTVSGGTPGYTYDWLDLPGTINPKDRSGISSGTYSVTVTDANGCTTSVVSTVSGPSVNLFSNVTSFSNVSCNGANNGSINIQTVGGTPSYNYLWNDGSISQNRTGLSSGTYYLTVTDSNGCSTSLTQTILQPEVLILSVSKQNPTCPPNSNAPFNSNGTIDLSVSGGTIPYSYSWSNLPSSPDPEDQVFLSAGTYSVLVTDTNGCLISTSIILTELNGIPNVPTEIKSN